MSWPRSPPTAFEWIWQTLDSVTPRIGALEYRLQVDSAGRILGGIVTGQDVRLSRLA